MMVHMIGSFLGLVRYYQRFIEGFSKLFGPITILMKNNVKFIWTKKCERNFEELKRWLTMTMMLALLESHRQLVVFSDA